MIQLLRNKAFAGILLFLTATGLLFYYREELSTQLLSNMVGYKFEYYLSPFMPLISILLIAVNLGLFVALMKNDNLSDKDKAQAAGKHMLTYLICGLIGWGIHLFTFRNVLETKGSISALEQNLLFYHISDISLVLGFAIGAILFLRKAIHHGKIDF